jgi:chromosome partitioning protein
MNTIAGVAESVNPDIRIEGLLRTMYDPRNTLTNEVSEQLTQHFGERVYQTVIPRNVRLAEAPSHGEPILIYDPQSKGAKAYLALADELLQRDRKRHSHRNQSIAEPVS